MMALSEGDWRDRARDSFLRGAVRSPSKREGAGTLIGDVVDAAEHRRAVRVAESAHLLAEALSRPNELDMTLGKSESLWTQMKLELNSEYWRAEVSSGDLLVMVCDSDFSGRKKDQLICWSFIGETLLYALTRNPATQILILTEPSRSQILSDLRNLLLITMCGLTTFMNSRVGVSAMQRLDLHTLLHEHQRANDEHPFTYEPLPDMFYQLVPAGFRRDG